MIGRPAAESRCDPADSVRITADDFGLIAAPQGPPGLETDRVLDELDRTIGEAHVDAAGMVAGRGDRGTDSAPL